MDPQDIVFPIHVESAVSALLFPLDQKARKGSKGQFSNNYQVPATSNYERNFPPVFLIYVDNTKNSVYVESPHNFNIFFSECTCLWALLVLYMATSCHTIESEGKFMK